MATTEPKKEERHQRLFGTDIALRSDSLDQFDCGNLRPGLPKQDNSVRDGGFPLALHTAGPCPSLSLYCISDLPADSSHFGPQSIGLSVKYVVYI